jgi:hypothetical protein
MGVVLLAGWLGVSASARAQYPVPASGDVPPHAYDDAPPPGAAAAPAPAPAPGLPPACPPGLQGPPVPMNHPESPGEAVPDNGFSNIHPEQWTRSPCFYIGADYLLWWVRKDHVPLLATTGNIMDAVPGAIGQTTTVPALGGEGFGADNSSGARVSGVFWFDNDHTLGVDASGFWLAEVARQAQVSANGDPNGNIVLARPFYNVNIPGEDANPVTVPGVLAGGILANLKRDFWGADANARLSECVDCGPITRLTFLGGVRYLDLSENLLISQSSTEVPDSNGDPGDAFTYHDNFQTFNRFYGGQIGLETESRVGPLVLTVTGKVAFGETRQTVKIGGDSLVVMPDGTSVYDPTRGFLVQPTNIGRFSRNQFSVVPELIANLAWEFNEHVRVSVGYNFLFWTNVVRPGEQIDTNLNVGAIGDPGQLGNNGHPIVLFTNSQFWAQGFSAGLQISF